MIVKAYRTVSPTIASFHACDSRAKSLVGAVGTGKTTAAIWDIGFNLPRRCFEMYGITETVWIVVRKTFEQLMETDFQEAMNWFVQGSWRYSKKTLTVRWPASENCKSALTVKLMFLSCNTPEEEEKFRSMNVTGVWIDEADKVPLSAKITLKQRIGRYPPVGDEALCPTHFTPAYFLETCNPFAVDHQMYTNYDWMGPKVLKEPQEEAKCTACSHRFPVYDEVLVCPKCGTLGELTGNKAWASGLYDCNTLVRKLPPGPIPAGTPLAGHVGFWQEAGENRENLREGYWDAIAADYQDVPEYTELMVKGKPGMRPEGKPVYRNFKRDIHMAAKPLMWKQERDAYTAEMRGVKLFRGWDNTGTFPACVLVQVVGPFMLQVLREFYDDRMGLIDLTNMVVSKCKTDFPGAEFVDYCDPAGFAEQSDRNGGLTSPAQMQREICGLDMLASIQDLRLRTDSVDQMLARRDGMLIDPSCVRLLNGFTANYVYEENVRMGLMEFKEKPKKNKASHLHDALQYIVVKLFSPMRSAEPTADDTFERDWADTRKRREVLVGAGRTGFTPEHDYDSVRRGNTGGDAREWRRRT